MAHLYLKENPKNQKDPSTAQVNVVGLIQQKPKFNARPVHEEFVIAEVALIQGFLQVLLFSHHYHCTSAPCSFIILSPML